MKKQSKQRNQGSKGITLIALVITIIVLLILAGVTIATLTGDNGILKKVNEVSERTEKAKEEELRRLTAMEAATHFEEYEYIDDSSGKKVVIPAECAVSQVKGENTLKDGLVIIDSNGNEWVWIEVPNTIYLTANNSTDYLNIEKDMQVYASAYTNKEKYSDIWISEEQFGFESENEYINLKNKMLENVYSRGGFYIGRYEIGSFDEPVKTNDISRKPVIQKGAYPYNYITCKQAQQLSNNLKPSNKGDFTSSLMFGIQWDLVCKFLEEKTNMSESEINSNSYSWGNYTNSQITGLTGKYAQYDDNNILGDWNVIPQNFVKPAKSILFTTGASQYMKKMNIYDFAGNVYEYTLSSGITSSEYICVGRGGFFGVTTIVPASRIW